MVFAMLVKRGASLLSLPPIIGYILLGVFFNYLDQQWHFFNTKMTDGLKFLADAGVAVLLFRVGLESNLFQLIRQFRRALVVWFGNVSVSFLAGYWMTNLVLGFGLVPSLVVATALSATSLAVTADIWRDSGALNSGSGGLFIDVAELDDISSILLMALIIPLIPALKGDGALEFWLIFQEAGKLLIIFLAFCAGCYLFAHYLERPITTWFLDKMQLPVTIVVVAGFSFIISGLAAFIGFSLAVGAMFAGLAFSQDPAERRIDEGFEYVYGVFAPFFFIGIGLSVDLASLGPGTNLGLMLLIAAIFGKLIGTGAPALAVSGGSAAVLVSISMVPRSEIAMIVMQQGRNQGDAVVPVELYSAMVMVSLITCLVVPIILKVLLRRMSP
ncbi:MAG: cation:proton antiporter [Rhodospirillales bacterium]|nr:cation:proton antiporter [Rhodospirillales bacterium]